MTTLVSNACVECTLRLANNLEPICDGTGVISVSDIGESRVIVCPGWPCDEDEPLAYWEAQKGLGYDIPPSLQQRIHANVMAEIQQTKPAPISSQTIVTAEWAAEVERFRSNAWAVLIVAGMLGLCALAAWSWTR